MQFAQRKSRQIGPNAYCQPVATIVNPLEMRQPCALDLLSTKFRSEVDNSGLKAYLAERRHEFGHTKNGRWCVDTEYQNGSMVLEAKIYAGIST